MTDTPAHTPLRLSAGDETRIMDNRGYPLLDVKCGGMTGRTVKEGEQIAAFIVRACNSHYQLVSALRGIIDHFDCSHGNAPGHDHLIPGVWDKDVSNGAKGGTQCVWCEQWNEARAALSQAGGASD